ncbi:LytR/AlgR family response regulator transcription factor [Sediminitomix flava]|uniref:LytTR family transcriptional regulator n=1 Tax=Sediminitomix flava TaxID=379075 RepID=A0A315Z6P2_SEDFL|nr:LytTR family DNA-binding domain-containing protein [Sediminitomix flava]PWJ40057.1 LytTR family transcriptional regulator [Sediminitomix flava]
MSSNIFEILSYTVGKPWNKKSLTKMAWGTAVFVSLFLILFMPFGIRDLNMPFSKIIVLLGYGMITGGVLHLSGSIINIISDIFPFKLWQVLVATFIQMGLIALANSFYSISIGLFENNLSTVLEFIYYTYLVGVFPTLFITLFRHKKALSHKYDATQLDNQSSENYLTLIGQNQDDQITLKTEDFLFMQSSDNYTTLFYLENQEVRKAVLRGSLTYFQNQIEAEHIARCHRSYIVNFQKVILWEGNSGGGKITLSNYTEVIPVSRNYAQKWNSILKKRLPNIPK